MDGRRPPRSDAGRQAKKTVGGATVRLDIGSVGMIITHAVVKSFKKTDLSNALDASEDHLVWDGNEASEANGESKGDSKATTSDVSRID